jgi:hypothetical protein
MGGDLDGASGEAQGDKGVNRREQRRRTGRQRDLEATDGSKPAIFAVSKRGTFRMRNAEAPPPVLATDPRKP